VEGRSGKKIKHLRASVLKDIPLRGNTVKPANDFREFAPAEIEQSIFNRFENQVKRVPHQAAVITDNRTLTYEQLNQWANRLAHTVLKQCPHKEGRNPTAALLFGQGAGMIAAIVGVLKAALVYVPLDADHPPERLTYILKDAGVGLLVTDGAHLHLARSLASGSDNSLPVIDIDRLPPKAAADNPGLSIEPHHPAYVLYTSGSTGKPKGVVQNHRNVLHFARVYTNALHLHEEDRLSLLSSYSFDAAKMDIYGALLNGAALLPFDIKQDLSQLVPWLRQQEITVYHSIPTVFRYVTGQLAEVSAGDPPPGERFPHLRLVVLGGEAVFKRDVESYRTYLPDHCLLVNGLGPTESTVTLQYFIDKETVVRREAVPVGFPVERTAVYLIDDKKQQAPVYGSGEIVYRSDFLAVGYLNNPEQTAEVLGTDPVKGSGRVYRSGDLGRRLPDGSLEYVGRRDSQVKVSGYRIEPAEIEGRLDRIDGVAKSVVVCQQDQGSENYLTAYYMSRRPAEIRESRLVEHLKTVLPDYMIPRIFLELEAFPLTATGKIDRKELASRDTAHLLSPSAYVPPSTPLESQLAAIWQSLLGIEKIGIDENFFVRGGNSLKAVLLVGRIHRELKVKIPLAEIFRTPTIRQLAAHISTAAAAVYEGLRPVEKRDYYPLSPAQARLYLLHQLDTSGIGYNISEVSPLDGELDAARAEEILKQLIRRHESLRTAVRLVGGRPVQKVYEPHEVTFCIQDDPDTDFTTPFDLSRPPLLRARLVRTPREGSLLFLDMHHVVSDGFSHHLLVQEFLALKDGKPLPRRQLQYKDYADWQHSRAVKEVFRQQEAFWLNELAGDLPLLSLPLDFPRPEVQSLEGGKYRFGIAEETAQALKACGRQQGASLFMVLLALYNVLLAKLSRQEDIIVGTVVSGRNRPELETIVGVFARLLPLRSQLSAEKSFAVFLQEVSRYTLRVFENQDYPFENLVEKFADRRDRSRHPLMDAGFTLQNFEQWKTPGKSAAEVEQDRQIIALKDQRAVSKKDINLEGYEVGGGLHFIFEYCRALFRPETIEAFARYLKQIMTAVIGQPAIKIGDIEMIGPDEKARLLEEFNRTRQEYPQGEMTLQALFRQQAARRPQQTALRATIEMKNIYDRLKSEPVEVELTYEELDERSDLLSAELMRRGVQAGSLVGLMARHPLELAVGIWGILKSGGAYLPVDPGYPPALKEFILKDSRVQWLVAEEQLADALPDLSSPPAVIDIGGDGGGQAAVAPCREMAGSSSSDHPAYVIYTSGTTGSPKAALIEQRGIVNYSLWRLAAYDYTDGDVTLQLLAYSFDGFGSNFYSSLLSGGTLYVVPDERKLDFPHIRRVIRQQRVSHMSLVPGMYGAVLEGAKAGDLASLRLVVLAGESSRPQLIRRSRELAPSALLVNEYGPTETAVTTAAHRGMAEQDTALLGRPIANTRIYILDRSMKPVPLKVPGELCVAGTGVGRGYLNNPELTAAKFINFNTAAKSRHDTRSPKNQPLNPKSYILTPGSQPLYRTGDLCRFLPGGEIEFLGRMDYQVKIRGFRIELEAIERQLLKIEGIEEAVVMVVDDGYLCAYVAAKEEDAAVHRLKEQLAHRLPDFMIPSHFVFLEKIPLTRSGKLDRRALPSLEAARTGSEYVAPATDLEKTIADILKEVLNRRQVGIHDNFFEIGGHSLNLVQVSSRLKEVLDRDVPIVTMFQYPTVSTLSGHLSGGRRPSPAFEPGKEAAAHREADTMRETLQLFDDTLSD
jgi:amino acid adenylation domain-containing protein